MSNVLDNYRPRRVLPSVRQIQQARDTYDAGRNLAGYTRDLYGNITSYFRRGNNTNSTRRLPTGADNIYAGRPRGMPSRGTNRVYSRKRRGSYRRRRRMRYGTKVRKHALGLFEGRRKLEIVRANPSVAARFVTRINLLENFGAGLTVPTGGDSIVTNVFAGRECFIRGFKMQWLVSNASETQPVDVRIICGWRKIAAFAGTPISSDTSAIFRNTTNKKAPLKLLETAHGSSTTENGDNAYWMLGTAPISKTHFHCEKDFTFRLGPGGNNDKEQVFGSNIKRFGFWWDLKNKRFTVKKQVLESATTETLEQNANWWPVVYYYHVTPLASGQETALVTYYKTWQCYYKDPIG